ncbi:PH domain-containing protein [Ammoniphilus sp. YIM 78166]|uniref:PH domain-containing protein n=1 Tax=Ammoniphilus sp. YIM 78166 TaxID=1644106 RepID=UPI0010702572|nr:PH domain-containing protein [Ammoniphilus sp. YIM 78166]
MKVEDIIAQIVRIDRKEGMKIINRPEIKLLSNVFLSGEEIQAFTMGTYQTTNGLIFATNHRLIFLDAKSWTPFPYASISEIDYKSSIEFQDGNLMGTIFVDSAGNKISLNKVPSTGGNLVRKVKQILEHYRPDARFHVGKKPDSPHRSSRKPLLMGAGTVLILLVAAVFWLSLGESRHATSSPTLGMNTSEFTQHWNQIGKQMASSHAMPKLEIVEKDQFRSFTHYFTDDMKIMGILGKDGKLQKLMMLGQDDGTALELIEQTISTVQPHLEETDKNQLIDGLGIFASEDLKEDRQIVNKGIRYSITYSDKIGIIFEAAAINN